jgi:AraC-like DNA-binding protein
VTEDGTEQVLPTVTGFAARQAIVALRKHNIATAPLLRRAGLSDYDFARGDGNPVRHRVPAVGQASFLDYAAEAMDDSAFGLHLAEQADPRDAGIIFYVASGAETLGEALTLFARYFRIVNEAVRLKLRRKPEGVDVEVDFIGVPRHSVRHNAEFGIAVIVKALRELAHRNICPTRAAFAHARNSDLREFERFYLCPVEFGRGGNEGVLSDLLEFSNEALAIPLFTSDPKLLEALQPFCEMAAKERATANGTVRAAVENEVEKRLSGGKAKKQTVAKALALSARTLSRRLADEGTSYEEVVDQLRQTLALQYIKDRNISFSQIAWLLGYEGATSFNHAFKRWTRGRPSWLETKSGLPRPEIVGG